MRGRRPALLVLARRVPLVVTHLALAATAAATGLLTYESGVAAGQYGSIYVWVMLVAAYFFPRRVAIAHLAWMLAVYAVTLAVVESTAGYSPLHPLGLHRRLAGRGDDADQRHRRPPRRRADRRARRFFDLSHDMLCTANLEGYFVELNSAWEERLGYSREELRAVPFVELVHPDDRERTEPRSASLFDGGATVGFENRYLAKDGSWHWLRWSSTLAPDESLIYARAPTSPS